MDQRRPLGDITNAPRQGVRSSNNNKRARDDDELRNIRRQKARDRYANMPLDKKAELNARKREAYHRKKAEKQSGDVAPLTGTPSRQCWMFLELHV